MLILRSNDSSRRWQRWGDSPARLFFDFLLGGSVSSFFSPLVTQKLNEFILGRVDLAPTPRCRWNADYYTSFVYNPFNGNVLARSHVN
jgi:hypothetical protein